MGKCRTAWQKAKKDAEGAFKKLGIKFSLPSSDGFGPRLDEAEDAMEKCRKTDDLAKKRALRAEFTAKHLKVAAVGAQYSKAIGVAKKENSKDAKAVKALDDLITGIFDTMVPLEKFLKDIKVNSGKEKEGGKEIKLKIK